MTAEIIKFPRTNKRLDDIDLPSLDELQQEEIENTEMAIDKATEIIAGAAIERLMMIGYPVKVQHGKDICMMVESIRSLMHRYYDKEHCFHPLADMSFEADCESGAMRFIEPSIKRVKKKKTANTDIKDA